MLSLHRKPCRHQKTISLPNTFPEHKQVDYGYLVSCQSDWNCPCAPSSSQQCALDFYRTKLAALHPRGLSERLQMVPLEFHSTQMPSLPNVPDRHPAKNRITGNLILERLFPAVSLHSDILSAVLKQKFKIECIFYQISVTLKENNSTLFMFLALIRTVGIFFPPDKCSNLPFMFT